MSKIKSQRKKENPCLNVCIVRTSEQGFYDRLLLRGLCDNRRTKRQIRRKRKARKQENTFTANKQSRVRYAMKRKISERAICGEMPKAVQRASPLALAFPFCDLPELSRRALVWRSEATPLVIDKRTPRCQC